MTFTFDELKLARERGYSDDEIWNTLSTEDKEIGLAKERGYSLEEVASITSGQPLPTTEPEPDQPFFAVEDVVSAIGTIPEALSVGVPAAFQKLVTGTAMPEESEAIEKDIAFQERMRQEQQDRQAAGKSSMVGEAIREAAPSIATSFGGLGAGIAGAVGGTVVGGPVGGTVGGMAASGTASYRMAAADLLYRSFKALEEQKGSPLTEEEKAQAYKEFLPLAQNSALWEAGPEAVSNAVLLGAGKFVFGFGKPLARKLVGESIERVNKGIASKVAAGVGATATELGTETITAVGQFPAQAKAEQFIKTGTTEGAPTEYPGGAMQAFKDVAPATLALTGMMAGAGGVAKAATLPFQKAKTPEQIAEDNINLDADREADNLLIPDNDTESKSIKSQIDTERADLALKKELYNTLPDGDKTKAVLATEIKEYEGRITELDNTLRQRLGLSLPITTAEQQQIELAKQIAAPAKKEAKLPAMPSIEEQTSEAAYGRELGVYDVFGAATRRPAKLPKEIARPTIPIIAEQEAGLVYGGETGVYDVFGGVRRRPAPPVAEAPAVTPASAAEVAIPASDKKEWVIKATEEGLVPDKITFQELRDEAFNYGAMDGDWLGNLEPQGNKGDLPARQDIEDVFGRKFTDEEFTIIQQEYVNGVNEMEATPAPQPIAPSPTPPPTPAETPAITPAPVAEAPTVSPAPEVAPAQRDLTKPEQMTPEEFEVMRSGIIKRIEESAMPPKSELQKKAEFKVQMLQGELKKARNLVGGNIQGVRRSRGAVKTESDLQSELDAANAIVTEEKSKWNAERDRKEAILKQQLNDEFPEAIANGLIFEGEIDGKPAMLNRVGLPSSGKDIVRNAIRDRKSVSAVAIESYDITLPEGYTKQGDLYVYQPTTAVSETITPAPEVAPESAGISAQDKDYATGNPNTPFYWENDSWKVDATRLPNGAEVLESSDGPTVYVRNADGSVSRTGVTVNGRHEILGRTSNNFMPSQFSNVPRDEAARALDVRVYETDRLADIFPALDQATAESLVSKYPPAAPTKATPSKLRGEASAAPTPTAPEVAPEEALNRMDKIAEIKAQWKAELDAMPANNKNQRALRSSFIEYIWNQKSSLDELERIAADQFFKERSKTKELGKLQEDIDAENNEKVDFDNARQLVESLTGETGDAIRALVNTSPKLTSALEKIKVESGSPSFDGSVIRIRRTNNTPQTKAHEVTHAILDKAIDEVPTFRTDIAKIIKEFFRVGDWNANIYGDLSKEVRQKMEIVSRIYRQAITGYGSFGKSQDISFSRYFSSNLAFLVKTIQPSLRGYKITDQDVRFVYALTGEHEFLAAIMSDQEFRDLAKELKLYQKPKSLFDRFIEAIKSLFGKKPIQGPVTQLDKVMNLVEDVINNEAYQPGPYKRYYGRSFAPQEKPAEEKITDPVTPDEQTQQLVQQAQEQESLVDSAVKEAGTTVFDVFNRLVNEGKTEEQVAKELGISNYDVRKYKLRADTAILNKMKQNKVKPLAFAPKNPVAEFAEKNLRKYFTKEGWLPKAVFQSWVKRNAVLSREQKEAEFAIKDLYTGIREVFGISKMEMIVKGLVSVPPEFVQQLNDALAGKIDINTMPEPVREPLVRMRQHIDSMSRQLVDLNVLPDELAAKVTSNLKVYLTRSYKIFTDKNWINKIPTEKLTAARNFLYQQQLKNDPEATIEMADRELRNMLNDWASDAEGIRKRGGKLGAKDLSVMMKRAEVPKVLRDVMGENTNVIFNYANTIGKISRFVADQKFLNEVKAKGAGEFLFTEKDAPKGFNTQIAAEESRTMSPLNGLRTTPEIAKAFEEFGKGYDIRENPGLRLLAWMNAVGKLNLTVGSVLTQMRNLLGQPAFFVFNGHYNWKVIRQEIDAIAKEMGISQEEAKRELVKQAAVQGLVNENAYAGELRTAFQDVGLETFDDIGPDEFTKQFVLTRMYLKGVKSAQELYQKTDEFGKLVGWLNETKRIQRMNKGMDKKTAQSIAAERTRDTYPTYSQSSEALRLFRRQPFVGPFATFFYETFRTSFHNLRYAFEDINGPTPEHKAEGIKRLAGAMATISMGAFGINLLSKLASGIGDEEEEDVRRMLPPWSKDASLAWMPKSKDGTYNFINVSYINPYNALTDPFIAMMSGFARGEKPEEIAVQALGSFLSPFTSEQPITATIGDAARNRTSTGKQIYNPQDDIATKTSKIMLHIFGKTFTPGTITRLRERIIPAIQGETVGTRAPAPAKEIAAELTGIRFETLDMKSAFSSKAWEFSRAANESERIFRDVATRRRRVDEQEQVDAYRRSEETRYEIWNDMYRDYMAVRRAGASQGEAVRLMTDIGISKKEAIAISKGRYVPYEISNEVLRRSKLNGNVVPVKQIRAIGKEMPRVLNDIPKTP